MTRGLPLVVGRGRMGLALARSLPAPRARSLALAARSVDGARLGPGPRTVFLAVTDRHIEEAAARLAPGLGRGDVAFHLAGMRGPEALAALKARRCAVAALHPLVAISGVDPPGEFTERPTFLVEGDRAAVAEAKRVAKALGGVCVVATAVERAAYHSAAALVATGATALAQGAAHRLRRSLTPAPSPREERAMIASLLRSVARNVEAHGPEGALASPLLRGDTGTVRLHLDTLDAVGAGALYAAALGVVLGAAEAVGAVTPETVEAARALLRERARAL
ncbi:MAG: DUF2520 domain-containing protein [Polyangiales bacterium]